MPNHTECPVSEYNLTTKAKVMKTGYLSEVPDIAKHNLRSAILASVLSVTNAGCAKTAEWIDVLFGVETHKDPRNNVLKGDHHPPPR